jgi:hypothetical protein
VPAGSIAVVRVGAEVSERRIQRIRDDGVTPTIDPVFREEAYWCAAMDAWTALLDQTCEAARPRARKLGLTAASLDLLIEMAARRLPRGGASFHYHPDRGE